METIKKIRRKIGIEIKAGFWYTVGSLFFNGVTFITIPIFTRLLTTSEYGIVSLFSIWVKALTIVVGMSLNSSVIRAYYDFKEDYKAYLSSTLFLSFISFMIVTLAAALFQKSFSSLMGFSSSIVIIILIQSYFTFVINFNNMKYIGQYQYKKYLLIAIVNTLLDVVLSTLMIIILVNQKYLGKIYGALIPISITGLIIFISTIIKGKKLINFKYWKYALVLSVPMIPHLLAHLVLGQSDRILIDKYIGSDAVGLYSFAYNIGMISQVVLSSLNNAWVPWFTKKMDEESHEEILAKSKIYLLTFIILIIGLIFISPEMVKIMAPPAYREAMWIIPIIICSYFFQFLYNLLVNVQFYLKKNYFIPIGTVTAALINIGLNIYYIPLYGYQAAVYSTLASYIVLFLMHYLVTRYVMKSKIYSLSFFIKPTALVTSFVIIFYLIGNLMVIRYLMIILVICFCGIKYKRTIAEFINKV